MACEQEFALTPHVAAMGLTNKVFFTILQSYGPRLSSDSFLQSPDLDKTNNVYSIFLGKDYQVVVTYLADRDRIFSNSFTK